MISAVRARTNQFCSKMPVTAYQTRATGGPLHSLEYKCFLGKDAMNLNVI